MVVIRSRWIPVNEDKSSATPSDTVRISSAHGYTRCKRGARKRQRHFLEVLIMGDKLVCSLMAMRVFPPARRAANKAMRFAGVFAVSNVSGFSRRKYSTRSGRYPIVLGGWDDSTIGRSIDQKAPKSADRAWKHPSHFVPPLSP